MSSLARTVSFFSKTVLYANPQYVSKRRGGRKMNESQSFTFGYNGREVNNLFEGWTHTGSETKSEKGVTKHIKAYLSPDKIIRVEVELSEFSESAAIEWILRFRNESDKDAPILEKILPLNMPVPVEKDDSPHLLYSLGCFPKNGIDNYGLQKSYLRVGSQTKLTTGGGKTIGLIPFFNLTFADRGYIGAVGWAGKWLLSATREAADKITLEAGMEQVRISLHAGEEMRSPSILLLPWEGDFIDAHNALRRHIAAYHSPQERGTTAPLPMAHTGWGGLKTETAINLARFLSEKKLGYDTFWMDAGWYGEDREVAEDQVFGEEDWFLHAGNWNVNRIPHPNGLKPVSEEVHKLGMKYLLWFEPERVVVGTPLSKEHPEWLIGVKATNFGGHRDLPYVRSCLFDFGNSEAREWMTDWISHQITELGIDVFRQDCNDGDLHYYWKCTDTRNRQGITEIRYVEGLLEFWDELLRRHPGLLLDIVQRGDLDTISRACDLTRSDYPILPESDPIGNQVGTQGLAMWRPHFGTCMTFKPGDTYMFRSALSPGMTFAIGSARVEGKQGYYIPEDYPFDWARTMIAQQKRAAPLMYGDYFPLTMSVVEKLQTCGDPWGYDESLSSIDRTQWFSWEMVRPDLDEGLVLAIRRQESSCDRAVYKLRGLKDELEYAVEDADTGERFTATGEALQTKGIEIVIGQPRSSRLFFFKALP